MGFAYFDTRTFHINSARSGRTENGREDASDYPALELIVLGDGSLVEVRSGLNLAAKHAAELQRLKWGQCIGPIF